MAHDLLVNPLLSWRDTGRRRARTTLPGVLARLASGELADFPRLRTHQLHPWCMFLTQLAAIVLRALGLADPRLSEEEWRRGLLHLTDGQHEPWRLVVDDLSKAAFFQPPVPEGSVAKWTTRDRPDDIDVLVTAKSHDVKQSLMRGDEPETWAYALVALQTTQGYAGSGHNAISRMNKGYGSRARVGLTRDHSLAARFLRDVKVLLNLWPLLIERGYRENGIALVWLEPWDGRQSLPMEALAPHFIEVCGRRRCFMSGQQIHCRNTTTTVRRCISEIETGDVGDAWIPISRLDRRALTVSKNGFTYQKLAELFDDHYVDAPAQQLLRDDAESMFFVASVMARGQGETQGLHERILPLTKRVLPILGQPDARAALGKRASERVASAQKMRSKVLFPALKQLVLQATPPNDGFDARVDEIFFDHLFGTIEMGDEEARLAFERELRVLAQVELAQAIDRSATADARRFKAISAAESMFNACLRKNFSDLFTSSEATEGVSA